MSEASPLMNSKEVLFAVTTFQTIRSQLLTTSHGKTRTFPYQQGTEKRSSDCSRRRYELESMKEHSHHTDQDGSVSRKRMENCALSMTYRSLMVSPSKTQESLQSWNNSWKPMQGTVFTQS